jgi:DNA-binding transcriptional regulator LsrR (DeoR family)
MNVKRSHLVQWKRETIKIDQKKLATLRYTEGWTIKKLAEHFKIRQASIKIHLNGLDRSGGTMKGAC